MEACSYRQITVLEVGTCQYITVTCYALPLLTPLPCGGDLTNLAGYAIMGVNRSDTSCVGTRVRLCCAR